jgi:hypothetical protein
MSYTLVAAYWTYGGAGPCLGGIHKPDSFCGVAMDFFDGLCHVAYHQRILGWHLPCYELLFFGPLRIRYEIRYQGGYHDCRYPGLWRQYWTGIVQDQIRAFMKT